MRMHLVTEGIISDLPDKKKFLYAKSKLTPAQLHMQRGVCQWQGAGAEAR